MAESSPWALPASRSFRSPRSTHRSDARFQSPLPSRHCLSSRFRRATWRARQRARAARPRACSVGYPCRLPVGCCLHTYILHVPSFSPLIPSARHCNPATRRRATAFQDTIRCARRGAASPARLGRQTLERSAHQRPAFGPYRRASSTRITGCPAATIAAICESSRASRASAHRIKIGSTPSPRRLSRIRATAIARRAGWHRPAQKHCNGHCR